MQVSMESLAPPLRPPGFGFGSEQELEELEEEELEEGEDLAARQMPCEYRHLALRQTVAIRTVLLRAQLALEATVPLLSQPFPKTRMRMRRMRRMKRHHCCRQTAQI